MAKKEREKDKGVRAYIGAYKEERLFHFSLREVFLAVLVLALALGWFVHGQKLQAEVRRVRAEADSAISRAKKWRGGAGALEFILKKDGWDVEWNLKASEVLVSPRGSPWLSRSSSALLNTEVTAPSDDTE